MIRPIMNLRSRGLFDSLASSDVSSEPNDKSLELPRRLVPDGFVVDVAGHAFFEGGQKPFDFARLAFGNHFHVAAGQIAHVAGHRVTLRQPMRGIAKAHALDIARIDNELANGPASQPNGRGSCT